MPRKKTVEDRDITPPQHVSQMITRRTTRHNITREESESDDQVIESLNESDWGDFATSINDDHPFTGFQKGILRPRNGETEEINSLNVKELLRGFATLDQKVQ